MQQFEEQEYLHKNGETSSQKSAPHKPNEEQERNAMRAYLQRSEVRLSTIHRVAVGFISGAGLLFLLPVFFKDAILSIISAYLDHTPLIPDHLGIAGRIANAAVYLLLFYPFVLSLGIPIAAMLLLLKDIIRFYFVGNAPGFPDELFNPRFILTGIGFSPDESEYAKKKILAHQYGTNLINFILPYDDRNSRYFSSLIDKPHRMIVPKTRKLPRLLKEGVVENVSGKSIDHLDDDDLVRVSGEVEDYEADGHSHTRTVKEIDRFNAALGLAAFLERPLYQEVAKTEVSLVRHSLRLRQLVLRYFQALLILLWTALLSFMMLPFLQRERFPTLAVLSIGYFIWSLLTPMVVQLPIRWLVSYARKDVRDKSLKHLKKNDSLEKFENRIKLACYISIATSTVALALETWLFIG